MNFEGSPHVLSSDRFAHPSALQHPSHVLHYLLEERTHNAIFGPFTTKPFGDVTHNSPFITREKANCDKRRVIVDLSWPHESSVNCFTSSTQYMGSLFRLQLPTVDHFVERLVELGPGAKMYKVLSRAFRQLKVDPLDFPLLCLQWQDEYFIDCAVAFGHHGGALGCCRFTDALRFIHTRLGFHLVTYIDDLMSGESPETAERSFHSLVTLLSDLNVPISKGKLTPPTTKMVCLGIEVDSVNQTLAIPKEKINQILDKCRLVLSKSSISKKSLQSLIGLLMFVHKAVKPARIFVNRLLQALRQCVDSSVKVNVDMIRDLQWFITFLEDYNGVSKYVHPKLNDLEVIALDACLTGMGAVYGKNVYFVDLDDVYVPQNFSIVHLEMWNILAACRI